MFLRRKFNRFFFEVSNFTDIILLVGTSLNPMNIITLTGPSGSGKTTLLNELVANHGFQGIVSHTTRKPRPGEIEGRDYYFVSNEVFEEMKTNNEFIESVEFIGNKYGVSVKEIQTVVNNGKVPLLIVEPNGVHQIEKFLTENEIGKMQKIFISAKPEILIARYLSRLHKEDLTDLSVVIGIAHLYTMN
jgi:guanylate kinase